jgi:Zn-dependent protease
MFKPLKIGRVAGINLFIHPTFWLLLLFVLISQGGLWAAAFVTAIFGCVVLHELGHALTARLYGIGTHDITLYPIGGVARLNRMPKSPGAELLISIAGPITNLVIAGVLFGVLAGLSTLNRELVLNSQGRFLALLLKANLALAAFNLIPAFPMDGGRILRALLSGWLGRVRATEIAATLGQTLALVLPLVMLFINMFSFMHIILAAFVYLAAGTELAAVRSESEVAKRRRFEHGPPPGYRWVDRGGGIWLLVPIVAQQHPARPFSEPSPWN